MSVETETPYWLGLNQDGLVLACVRVCGVVVETPALQDLTFSLEDRNEQKFDTKDILATGTARQELRGTGETTRLLRALGRI